MLAQLIKNFVHFKRGDYGFNQYRCLDRALRDAEFGLCHYENIVPQACFLMRFHLRKVEVGARTARQQFLGVVEEIKCKVKECT